MKGIVGYNFAMNRHSTTRSQSQASASVFCTTWSARVCYLCSYHFFMLSHVPRPETWEKQPVVLGLYLPTRISGPSLDCLLLPILVRFPVILGEQMFPNVLVSRIMTLQLANEQVNRCSLFLHLSHCVMPL